MLRRSLQAVLFVVALASLVADVHAARQRHRGAVINYLGGYGPGPFGHGDFVYDGGGTSATVMRHREQVPSYTTRIPYRTSRQRTGAK